LANLLKLVRTNMPAFSQLPIKTRLRLVHWLFLAALACALAVAWRVWTGQQEGSLGWPLAVGLLVWVALVILMTTSRQLWSMLGMEPTRLVDLMREMADGNLQPSRPKRSVAAQSVAGAALVLLEKLQHNREAVERRHWIDQGLAMLNDTVRNEHSVHELSNLVCQQLRQYLHLQACGLYLYAFGVEDDSMIQRKALRLQGDSCRDEGTRFAPVLEQLPADLPGLQSGQLTLRAVDLPAPVLQALASTCADGQAPEHVMLVPLTFENRVRGVLVLIAEAPMPASMAELIVPGSIAIGVALESALNRESVLASLVDAQRLTNQLQANHEKLQHSQSALKENIRYVRDILSSMHSGLVIVDAEGRIEDCNPALLKMTGLKREQLLQQHSSLLFQEDESSLLSILKGYGQMLTRLGLQDPKAYRDLLEGHLLGCLLINQQGDIVLANARAAALTGYSREALHQMPLQQLILPEMRARHQELVSMAQLDDKLHRPGAGRHLPLLTASGEPFFVEISLVNHQFEAQGVTLVLLRTETDLPWAVINSRTLERLAAQDEEEAMVAQLRHIDGHNTPVRINSSFLLDASGSPQQTVINVHDVSSLVLKTKEIRAQHQLLEMTMEAMQDGVVRIDREGRLVSANPMALELLGRKAEQMLDQGIDDLFPGQQNNHAITDWLPFRFPHLMRKLVQDLHHSSEAITKLPIPLLCLNEQGWLDWATPSACDLLGIDPPPQHSAQKVRLSDETAQQLQELGASIRPDMSSPQIIDIAWRAGTAPTMRLPTLIIPGGGPSDQHKLVWLIPEFDALCAHVLKQAHNIEWTVVHPAGVLIPVLLTASPLLDPYNRLTGAVVTFKDMRELKEKEAENLRMVQKMEQSQKLDALGQLAAGVAHDFNNLLGVIQNHAELVEMKLGTDTKAAKNLSAIMQATTRARDIVIKLNGLGREQRREDAGEDNTQDLFELEPLLHETQLLLQASLKGIDIVVMPDTQTPGLVMLKGQSGSLQQVLVNLCVNASHAIGDRRRGRIVIETHCPGPGQVNIDVVDNGSGIPPEILPRIFEPFFTTKEVGKGTGLGLAMVRSIVTRMDGAIECHSEVGVGTRFSLTLPCTRTLPSDQ
jgi:PAS domain S-box-containing protein